MKKFRRKFITGILLVLFVVGTYFEVTHFAPQRIQLRFENYVSQEVPASFHDVSIATLSDINSNVHNLTAIHDELSRFAPDIVLFTGNLFDGQPEESVVNEIQALLQSIPAELGKYAVLGDQDALLSADLSRQVLQNSGFKLLDNTTLEIHNKTDEWISLTGLSTNNPVSLTAPSDDRLNIAFGNNPDAITQLQGMNFDIMFAGKALNGQVRLPLIGSVMPSLPHYNAKRETVNQTELIISSGVATPKPDIRFLTKPDVVITLLKSSS